jgi:hypothetical protein
LTAASVSPARSRPAGRRGSRVARIPRAPTVAALGRAASPSTRVADPRQVCAPRQPRGVAPAAGSERAAVAVERGARTTARPPEPPVRGSAAPAVRQRSHAAKETCATREGAASRVPASPRARHAPRIGAAPARAESAPSRTAAVAAWVCRPANTTTARRRTPTTKVMTVLFAEERISPAAAARASTGGARPATSAARAVLASVVADPASRAARGPIAPADRPAIRSATVRRITGAARSHRRGASGDQRNPTSRTEPPCPHPLTDVPPVPREASRRRPSRKALAL